MLARLREFLAGPETAPEDDEKFTAPLAATMLLLEVAWADHDMAEDEIACIKEALRTSWGLEGEAVESTVARARELHDTSAGVYPFTRLLNETCSRQERAEILGHMWRLARFDGNHHHYEEAAIRRISDLLYLSHAEFIAAKLAAPLGGRQNS